MVSSRVTLKWKLILGFTVLTCGGLLGSNVVSYRVSSGLIQQMAEDDLRARVQSIEPTIRISYDENIQFEQAQMDRWKTRVLPEIGVSPEFLKTQGLHQGTRESVEMTVPLLMARGKDIRDHQFVDEIAELTGQSVTLFVFSPQGLLRQSTTVRNQKGERAVGTFIPPDSPVYKAIAEKKSFVGRAMVVDRWFLTAYEPILSQGKVVGAFFIGKPDTSYLLVQDHLRSSRFLESGYFFVLNSKGQFVVHPTKEGELALDQTDATGHPIFKEIIEKKSGSLSYVWPNPQTGKPEAKLAVFEYYPQLDWYVSASVPVHEVQKGVLSLRWILLGMTTGFVLFMILLTAWFGSWISSQLEQIVQKLLNSIQSLSMGSQDLALQSERLASSSVQAAASIEETVASLEEINSQVQVNSSSTVEAEKVGTSTLEAARSGEAKMKAVRDSIMKIENDSKRIQEMTALIDDIAFQTNLLSLNASVEAARAGEAGRGFAVVAEAVRNLSARAAESAKNISQVIQESRGTVEESVKIVNESEAALNEIVKRADRLASLVSSISSASGEQAKGIQQINGGMNQLDQATQSNAASAEQISATSAELRSQNNVLQESVDILTELVRGEKKAA